MKTIRIEPYRLYTRIFSPEYNDEIAVVVATPMYSDLRGRLSVYVSTTVSMDIEKAEMLVELLQIGIKVAFVNYEGAYKEIR